MKEELYAIPVNDAFDSGCECPICAMYHKLELDAIEYTMGPSYMEADTREKTDAAGFCRPHLKAIYEQNNRLGMAWVMRTRYEKVINDVKKATPSGPAKLLKKDLAKSKLIQYLDKINQSCFICDRVRNFYANYVDTIFILYKKDENFRAKFAACNGFCSEHYAVLLKNAAHYFNGPMLEEFVNLTNDLYIKNMERVRDDLQWFINKFDYNYQDEPWYNAKDSVLRSMVKEAGAFVDENSK